MWIRKGESNIRYVRICSSIVTEIIISMIKQLLIGKNVAKELIEWYMMKYIYKGHVVSYLFDSNNI